MRSIALDWSGRARGEREAIWIAWADGELLRGLEKGRNRPEAIAFAIELAGDSADPVLIGLDFAFSLPEWWCRERELHSAPGVWRWVAERGESILADPRPPFWGRRGSVKPPLPGDGLRATERHGEGRRPKSVFQIGGAGAVGTGSLRGMPQLLRLREAGFGIWPFSGPGPAGTVVEIYPALFAPDVRKSRRRERLVHLQQLRPRQPRGMLARAAGSEDAFDAAISALALAHWAPAPDAFRPAPAGDPEAIEGSIWRPGTGGSNA
jgi:hypothetical protein